MLVKRNARKAQKIVLEVVQVPGDGLAIEARGGITDAVVQIAGGFDLEAREDSNDFAVGFHHGGSDVLTGAILGENIAPAVVEAYRDRKSTRLNSSHRCISYAVFSLKKKNEKSRAHA